MSKIDKFNPPLSGPCLAFSDDFFNGDKCERVVQVFPDNDPDFLLIKITFWLPQELWEAGQTTKFGFITRLHRNQFKALKEAEKYPIYETKE